MIPKSWLGHVSFKVYSYWGLKWLLDNVTIRANDLCTFYLSFNIVNTFNEAI